MGAQEGSARGNRQETKCSFLKILRCRPELPLWLVIVLLALFLLVVDNFSLWKSVYKLVEADNPFIFPASLFVVLLAFFALLLTLVSFRPIFKIVAILVLLTSASAAYFMDNYATLIDKEMVRNVFGTDFNEATELFSPRLALMLILAGIIPSWFLYKTRIRYPSTFFKGILLRTGMILACLGIIAGLVFSQYQEFSSFGRNNRDVRHLVNPANYIFSLKSLIVEKINSGPVIVKPIETDAKVRLSVEQRGKPSLVILVVGETARAMNFSLNGYKRVTNPLLAQEEIVNFSQTHSCGTATAVSLPCMFQKFTRSEYSDSRAKSHEGLLHVVNHAGYRVLWRDNNTGCKGACAGLETENLAYATVPEYCDDRECLDMVLLHDLQQYINRETGDVLIVLHQKGNHGPAYYRRYPEEFEKFKPVCKTNQLQSCTSEEITNAYDNVLLYTDYFLVQTIKLLKENSDKYNTAMMYMSDHGESLGENNLYLHGLPYMIAPDYQKHVPFIAWLSEGYQKTFGISLECLATHHSDELSHDNLFSSMLGLLDIQTQVYDRQLDVFASCRNAP